MQAILDHLNDYKQHYTARYLEWIERTTGRAAFAQLANAMLAPSAGDASTNGQNPFGQFRIEDLRLVGCDLVVPIIASPALYAGWSGQGDTLTQAIVQSLIAADCLAADLAAGHTAVDSALSKVVAEPVETAEGGWKVAAVTALTGDANAKAGKGLGAQSAPPLLGALPSGKKASASGTASKAQAAPLLKPEFYVHVDDDVRTLVDGLHLVAGFV